MPPVLKKHPDPQTSKPPNLQASKHPNLQASKPPSLQSYFSIYPTFTEYRVLTEYLPSAYCVTIVSYLYPTYPEGIKAQVLALPSRHVAHPPHHSPPPHAAHDRQHGRGQSVLALAALRLARVSRAARSNRSRPPPRTPHHAPPSTHSGEQNRGLSQGRA